jgi:nitrite reductase/ring-hydroxylating ferredoxin subunit
MPDGRVLSMQRPAPKEGEPRLAPFLGAISEMIRQGGLSRSDALSLAPILAKTISFEHAKHYAETRDLTAKAMCEKLGVTRQAQDLVLANFTLACSFSPMDRISGSAFMSSANFYMFDASSSLSARWLRTHPARTVHHPLIADIEAHGGTVALYSRAIGLEKHGDRVDTVIVDRRPSGTINAMDFAGTPRNLLNGTGHDWTTSAKDLALARTALAAHDQIWLALDANSKPPRPIAWSGNAERPASPDDDRWLAAEWTDAARTRVRLLAREFETIGTIDERDVPNGSFRELFAERDLHTEGSDLARLRASLHRESWRVAARVQDLTQPASVLLFVGRIDGKPRAFSGICTHLGGRLRYDSGLQAFGCDIHGSRFSCDGQLQCGPAEAGLLAYRLVPSSRPAMLDIQLPCFGRITANHVVMATDVTSLRQIIQASPSLHHEPTITRLLQLRTTSVTVVRFVINRHVDDRLALFCGFPTLDSLFNVSKLQSLELPQYSDREHEVIELQLYRDGLAGQLSREELIRRIRVELKQAYGWQDEPEILEPVHVATFRGAYSSFDPESESARPEVVSSIPGLYFAGDWVRSDEAAWYMERAARTGRLAARAIVAADGGPSASVPVVEPVRTPWKLRSLAMAGRQGVWLLSFVLRLVLGLRSLTAGE